MIFGTSANCDQPSEPNTWCHGHIAVPPETQPGTYQVIWWWKYDRNPAGECSTCFEITVKGNGSAIQSREVDAKEPTQVIDTTSATAQVITRPQQAAAVVNNVPNQASTAVSETTTPALAPRAAPEVAAQVQIQPQQQPTIPQKQQATIHTEPLQLAYMTMDTPPSTANAAAPESAITSTSLGGANPPRVDTLADLSTKADQPLNVVPNFSIIRESKNKDYKQVDGFSSGDVGSLTDDAVYDHEGKDTSPLSLMKPSELINATLSGNKSARNGTTLTTGANTNATAPADGNSKTNNTAAAIVPGSHPSSTNTSSHKAKENFINRDLASQFPKVVDSAAAAVSFPTVAFLVSIVLATFTWMPV